MHKAHTVHNGPLHANPGAPVNRTKIVVGLLAVALPLAAVAGCGVEKKRTIKAELQSAVDNLQSSKALSMTLHLTDAKDNLAAMISSGDDPPPAGLAKALLGGSISFTIDPAGSKTLQQLSTSGTSKADITAQIKQVNAALVVRDDAAAIAELRLVDGALYAHVDLTEINRLAKLAGSDPVDATLDKDFGDDPTTAKALADVRAGKWLKIPVTDYIDKLKDLAKSFQQGGASPEPSPTASAHPDYQALGERVLRAVKPYVKVTDANNSSVDRVLQVTAQVRPALHAALAVLKATKDLPFADQLSKVDGSEIDKQVADGAVRGTITLSSGHLKQLSLDLESVRTLDPKAGAKTLQGAAVTLDVDDSASEVVAPTNVSSFDIGQLIDQLFSGLDGQQAA